VALKVPPICPAWSYVTRRLSAIRVSAKSTCPRVQTVHYSHITGRATCAAVGPVLSPERPTSYRPKALSKLMKTLGRGGLSLPHHVEFNHPGAGVNTRQGPLRNLASPPWRSERWGGPGACPEIGVDGREAGE